MRRNKIYNKWAMEVCNQEYGGKMKEFISGCEPLEMI